MDNTKVEDTLPVQDDMPTTGPSEQELLDAVLRNTDFLSEDEVPLPDSEDPVEVPEDSIEDPVDEEIEDAVSDEEDEEDAEETEGEDADDESATQEPTVFTADDLDLDAQVVVKIDGEEQSVTFGKLLKGFQTDAHLSKQGRELGEARKAFEAERETKIQELDSMSQMSQAVLMNTEQQLATKYHKIEADIKAARESGDTFELNELKDKREQAQSDYWRARKGREEMQVKWEQQKAAQAEQELNTQLVHFQEVIPSLIPDFDENVASEIRDFALAEGIEEGLLNAVVDPSIVKFIDDYRRLKQGAEKGAAKRKAVPAKKAVPTKKAKSPAKKKQDAAAMRRARAFKEDATPDDHMAFLRDFANKSLSGT
jgi:hypothetical protein